MARVFLLSRVRVGEESLQMVASTWVRYQKIRIRPGFACHLVLEDCSNVIDHRAARITGGHLFFGVLRIQPPSNKMPS